MRGIGLLRAARAAAEAPAALGWAGPGSAGLPPAALQLTSLLGFRMQQAAGFARHRGDEEEEEEELAEAAAHHRPHRHSKLSHSQRAALAQRKLEAAEKAKAEEEEVLTPAELLQVEEELLEELRQRTPVSFARRQHIRRLLRSLGRDDSEDAAGAFVTSFFGERQQADMARLAAAAGVGLREKPLLVGHAAGSAAAKQAAAAEAALHYRGEGGRFARPAAAAAAGEEEEDEEEEDVEAVEVEALEDEFQVALPEALSTSEEFDLSAKLAGLRPGSRRIMLAGLLGGGILHADPEAMREWQEIQGAFKPPDDFRMKVVDVNRTCKGTRTGGLYRYSCMVVVGNGNGVLGWGQGKAAEVNDAVQKAYQRACRNLYPIPRYNDHTIPQAIQSKYGQVKVTMYPKASGTGIMANSLMHEVCKMAGIHDIGIKLHGSRNVRNAIKCVFQAFDRIRTEDEVVATAAAKGSFVAKMPPGRYRHLRL